MATAILAAAILIALAIVGTGAALVLTRNTDQARRLKAAEHRADAATGALTDVAAYAVTNADVEPAARVVLDMVTPVLGAMKIAELSAENRGNT